jgi:hypothetical protein
MEVVTTDEFLAWYDGIDESQADAVTRYVGLLEQAGVALGHPYSSAIEGSRYALRELRVQASGQPVRVFYAFDPRRDAVLLIGGDKTGNHRFYEEFIPRAEKIWEQYLAEQKAGKHEEE